MSDPNYSAFSDVDMSHFPFVESNMARAAIGELMAANNLGYLNNPGGGQFIGNGFNCQVPGNDDVMDFERLRDALAEYAQNHAQEETVSATFADIEAMERTTGSGVIPGSLRVNGERVAMSSLEPTHGMTAADKKCMADHIRELADRVERGELLAEIHFHGRDNPTWDIRVIPAWMAIKP